MKAAGKAEDLNLEKPSECRSRSTLLLTDLYERGKLTVASPA